MPRNPQQDRKQKRLDAALRENLQRRKVQDRARNAADENLSLESIVAVEPGADSD